MLIGKYNKSVLLTYAGVACAVTGMMLAMKDRIQIAMVCLIISGICDLFDGVIARKCKRDAEEKEFGVQIDSLADMISFIAFPCVLGLKLLPGKETLMLPVLIVYTLCGIIRLAWFNMHTNTEGSMTHYDGLPVTYVALILPLYYLLQDRILPEPSAPLTATAYLLIALCFVLKIKIPKPRGIWYAIFAILAIAVSLLLLL